MDDASMPTSVKKPVGRTLAEFQPLGPAETKLLAACADGTTAIITEKRPDEKTDDIRIRAAFIRFLALGGDDEAPVHERGVSIQGAVVDGTLDLIGGSLSGRLALQHCRVDGEIMLHDATLPSLSLAGSAVGEVSGDRLTCCGYIFLCDGFDANGVVRFYGADIGGGIDCAGGTFANEDGIAFGCDRATAGGSLRLIDATFRGEVRLVGTRVTGNVEFSGSRFLNAGKRALNADGLTVADGLFWRNVADVEGHVDFTTAHAGTLVDDEASWHRPDAVLMNGFRYDRIVGPCSARSRIGWLRKQDADALGTGFAPQPWEQIARVLREMGHSEQARNVAIAREWARRRAGMVGGRIVAGRQRPFHRLYNRMLNQLSRVLHLAYGILAGFGYRPLWTVGWMVVAWLLLAGAYAAGNERGVFGPNSPILQTDIATNACGAPGDPGTLPWTVCPGVPAAYTTFQPLIYSLDLLLPVVDLQQQDAWSPMISNAAGETLWWGVALRWALWFEILFGWTTSALLIAVLGRLVDKD